MSTTLNPTSTISSIAASTGTITVHRVLTCTPEKIWRAFTQPDAFARWLPPNGFFAHVYEMNVKVGGTWRMSFTNFSTKGETFFGGKYIELRENECIAYTSSFEDPNLPGEMTTRVTMKAVAVGVEIHATQSGIPSMIPTVACYLGWQESLRHLARLVEPNIPG